MSKLFTTILPSLLAGGLLFGSTLTDAQPVPPAPPSPPTAIPAKPPKPAKAPKAKVAVQIDVDDIDELVDDQIDHALEAIGDNQQIPPQMRAGLKQRLEKVRLKVKKRLAKMSPKDLEEMGDELGKMGDEIGEEMEQFGKEMEQWGKQFEKHMKGKKVMVWKGQPDIDLDFSDHDLPGMDDFYAADDLDDAMKDLGSIKLAPQQRQQLKQLQVESDTKVATARKQLDAASENLQRQLENSNANVAEIERAIDNVTKLEADIRKARIGAWVRARKLLDESQRQKIERAARGGKTH